MQPIDIFPWDKHFNTGLDTIDAQHRILVEILNKLATNVAYESSENDLSEILDELTEYTLYHFQTEEAIWDKHLPNAQICEEHEEIHQEFVDTVVRLKSQQNIRPLSELADEALAFLAKWLASHILDTDRNMAYIIFGLQDGLSVVEAKIYAQEKMSGSSRLLIDIILSIYSTLSSNTLSLMRELKTHRVFEKKVKYQDKYKKLLLNLSTSFINLPIAQIDEAIENSLESMATFVGADRAYIFDYDIKNATSSNTYEWCAGDVLPQIDELQNIPIDVFSEWLENHKQGKYLFIDDVLAMPESKMKDILVPQDIKSLITMPLMQNNICRGFVGFDAVKGKYEFSQGDIELLDLFAKLLASIGERIQIDAELSKEKTFLKTLIRTIPDLIWLKDVEGRYLACNKRFEEFFGAKEEEIFGKTDYDFVDKELTDFFRMNDNKAMLSEELSVNEEEVSFASDGHKEILHTTKTPMRSSDGTLIGVLGVARDITQSKQHERHLEYIAHYDSLTGLPNRVLFSDRINQALSQTRRHKLSFAVVYLDLDGFKDINDTYGHEYGDKFLSSLSQYIKKSLREGDTIARIGGDEFVVVLLNLKAHEDSVPMLERLLKESSKKVVIDKIEMQVTASLGVTFFDKNDSIDADKLLRQADQAMYQAKLLGKNRYHIFDALKDKKIRTHHESLEEIAKALENEEFLLYYQPKINMKTGKVIGAEALIRWNHQERGILLPALFLPVIEGNILCVKLGEWVLKSTMKQIKYWKNIGLNIPISINVDAMQLQQSNFTQNLKDLLVQYPSVKPADFVLEILETSALEDIVHISQVMQTCRDMGIFFSLDDFGTGYSSLTYLKRLPVKELKIDQSFVIGMLEDSDDLAILDGVIGLSRAFRREIIAEGVESIEHGEMLLKLGCEQAQGYAIAHPMPAENILSWIKNYKTDERWKNTSLTNHDDLPLLYALVEHKAWIKGVILYLENKRQISPQLDHHECRFGEWLYGNGKKRYKDILEFQEVENIHFVIHKKINAIVNEHKNNKEEKDLTAIIDEIKSLSGVLVVSFNKFKSRRNQEIIGV